MLMRHFDGVFARVNGVVHACSNKAPWFFSYIFGKPSPAAPLRHAQQRVGVLPPFFALAHHAHSYAMGLLFLAWGTGHQPVCQRGDGARA
jgi:hypothetical protein